MSINRSTQLVSTYVDGALIENPRTIASLTGNISPTGNLNIAGQSYFTGQLDDIRIYNYALTDTQIKTLYNGGTVNFN